MTRLFGAYSLWLDALLNLDAARRDLVLPQLGIPEFLEALPSLRSECDWGWDDVGVSEGTEGKLKLVYKIKKI